MSETPTVIIAVNNKHDSRSKFTMSPEAWAKRKEQMDKAAKKYRERKKIERLAEKALLAKLLVLYKDGKITIPEEAQQTE